MHSEAELDQVAAELNDRPRKRLGYRNPSRRSATCSPRRLSALIRNAPRRDTRWRAREAGRAIALPATPCPRAGRVPRVKGRPQAGPAGTRSALDAWAAGPYQRPPPTRPRYAQHRRALPLATGRVATTARIRRSAYGTQPCALCHSDLSVRADGGSPSWETDREQLAGQRVIDGPTKRKVIQPRDRFDRDVPRTGC